jgi:putative addiction module component (TIGR02574 family)
MTANVESVITAALSLPNGDRVQVVEAVLASLQPDDRPPFHDSWRDVIARRSAELESGHVSAVPWSEVRRRSREQAGG